MIAGANMPAVSLDFPARAIAFAVAAWLLVLAPAGCGSSSTSATPARDAGGSTPDAAADAAADALADASADARSGTGTGADATADTGADAAAPLAPGFYVSPTGSDQNPGTLARPFKTLGKAQSAMQASASIKTTYVRAGTYALTASSAASHCDGGMGTTAIDLGAADAGETWSYYPPDGFGTAILDGGSTSTTTGVGCAFAADSAPNLTFLGMQLQRLQYAAIWANASNGLVVSSNTIHDLTVAVYNVGGVAVHSSSGVTVNNNFIHDVAYMGIGAWGGGMSNTAISGNVILSSCSAAANPGGNDMDGGDCGAIYTWDETHASTHITVTNNYVRDVNVSSNGAGDYSGCCATGIYLDDGLSNATVSGNVVTGIKSQCFVIHGGNDDTYTDNLCDLGTSQDQRIMTYQWDSLMLPMTGNVIENNIIVAGTMAPGTGYSDGGTPTAPTIKNNAYFNYVGSTVDSSGSNGSDANPTYENPQISCWDPAIASGSPVFSSPVSFVKLVGGWGPPGFVLPKTGSPPSWPHGC